MTALSMREKNNELRTRCASVVAVAIALGVLARVVAGVLAEVVVWDAHALVVTAWSWFEVHGWEATVVLARVEGGREVLNAAEESGVDVDAVGRRV